MFDLSTSISHFYNWNCSTFSKENQIQKDLVSIFSRRVSKTKKAHKPRFYLIKPKKKWPEGVWVKLRGSLALVFLQFLMIFWDRWVQLPTTWSLSIVFPPVVAIPLLRVDVRIAEVIPRFGMILQFPFWFLSVFSIRMRGNNAFLQLLISKKIFYFSKKFFWRLCVTGNNAFLQLLINTWSSSHGSSEIIASFSKNVGVGTSVIIGKKGGGGSKIVIKMVTYYLNGP